MRLRVEAKSIRETESLPGVQVLPIRRGQEDEVSKSRMTEDAFWNSILAVYPRARISIASKSFRKYIRRIASSGIRRLYYSPDADDAVLVLACYKKWLKRKTKGR